MGFFEILAIGVVALLVFGPEKLPKVIYDVSKVWRGFRSSARQLRTEFEQSVMADVKADIHNSEVMKALEENKIATENTLQDLKKPIDNTTFDINDNNVSKDQAAKNKDSSQ